MSNALIRQRARQSMRSNWGMAILLLLILGLIQSLIGLGPALYPFFRSFGFFDPQGFRQGIHIGSYEDLADLNHGQFGQMQQVSRIFAPLGILLNIIMAIVVTYVSTYQEYSFLDMIRTGRMRLDAGFGGFKRAGWGRILGTGLLKMLFVFLWSLLFIIPGIVKSFAYSQSQYLLLEDDRLTPREALKASDRMMKGYKGQLFGLVMYYTLLPMLILTAVGFAFGLVSAMVDAGGEGFNGIHVLLMVIFTVGIVIFMGYMAIMLMAAQAVFHDELVKAHGFAGGPGMSGDDGYGRDTYDAYGAYGDRRGAPYDDRYDPRYDARGNDRYDDRYASRDDDRYASRDDGRGRGDDRYRDGYGDRR